MDIEITLMAPKDLEKASDHNQAQEYLRKMHYVPTVFKKYSLKEQTQVREKVTQLPSDELVVIYLTFWENLCEHEIAKAICSTASRVLKIKKSALISLKEMIETNEDAKELCVA